MSVQPVLRVARPTNNLEALMRFYRDGLGLDLLYRFEGHGGFDGIMLGRPGAPYHLEFTRAHDHPARRAPSKDHLLVFYHPDAATWQSAIVRMKRAGFEPVASFNPYWDVQGATFEDPDGYRVVLQQSSWDL
jgi:catechol 2,3-dioxygenase-like lactoylglutathione lyase family enzyme